MLYGSETWAVRVDDVNRLIRAEMITVRWMCGTIVRRDPGVVGGGGVPGATLRERLGIRCISINILLPTILSNAGVNILP